METSDPRLIEAAAELCHSAEALYLVARGEAAPPPWEEAPEETRAAARAQVSRALQGPLEVEGELPELLVWFCARALARVWPWPSDLHRRAAVATILDDVAAALHL